MKSTFHFKKALFLGAALCSLSCHASELFTYHKKIFETIDGRDKCVKFMGLVDPSNIYGDLHLQEEVSRKVGDKTEKYQIIGINNNALAGNSNISSILFPPTLEYIGSNAFSNMQELESLKFDPNSTDIVIGKNAFSGCDSLTSISISVKGKLNIGDGAFENCTNLGNANFVSNSSYIQIGNNVFRNNSSLAYIGIAAAGKINIGNCAFDNCSNLKNANFGSNSSDIEIGNNALHNNRALTSIGIAAPGIVRIGDGAFENCTNIEKAIFGPNFTALEIGKNAFQNNNSLTSIDIFASDRVNIGNGAFANCTNLKNADFNVIPKKPAHASLIEVSSNAFANCGKLQSIGFKSATISINDKTCFTECNEVTTLYLPSIITYYGENALENLSSLDDIYVLGNRPNNQQFNFGYLDRLSTDEEEGVPVYKSVKAHFPDSWKSRFRKLPEPWCNFEDYEFVASGPQHSFMSTMTTQPLNATFDSQAQYQNNNQTKTQTNDNFYITFSGRQFAKKLNNLRQ